MAKQGLLIFNGCSFSVFKYILVSVEHAWQSLITVCFGLKLLIVKHLKGQLDPVCLRGSSENRSTPSPGSVLLLPKPRGTSPVPREGVSSQLCLVLIRNLWQELCGCFVARTPVYGGWVAASRAEPTAQHGAGGFSLSQSPVSLGAAGSQPAPISACRRQVAQRSQSFLCFNNSLCYGWFRLDI